MVYELRKYNSLNDFENEKDLDERMEYTSNLIKFQDVSQKLKLIEKKV